VTQEDPREPKGKAPPPEALPPKTASPDENKEPGRSRALVARHPVRPKGTGKAVTTAEPDALLQAYLREVRKYPLLSREEEHALAVRYKETGDRDALQQLVTSNLRFVVKIAFEYVNYRARLLDLIQEGNMGLVKAVTEFDPYKDVRLTTYAAWWIRSYIQDAILKNYSLVKLGTTQAQKRLFYRLRSEQKKLEQAGLGHDEGVKLLASRLDVREKDVEEMDRRLSGRDLSLNAPVSGSDGGESAREHIANLADPSVPVDDALADAEQRERFERVLGEFGRTLKGREKVVFEDRMIAENPKTLQEIGDKYGITKERVRQIEEGVKEKLKDFVRERFPDYELLTEKS
jgi:RNA polymerase sigma-32 factor